MTFRHSTCNEAFEKWPFADACKAIRRIGYTGIEIAPFTLAERPTDITAAQRNELDQAIAQNQVNQQESKIFGIVKPDEEHMLWPFDGEYWRDELGFYRQVVESACGR